MLISIQHPRIRDVWASNLELEMENIRNLLDTYNYIAMDTEFPGVVARPMGNFKNSADYHFQTLRCNVDLLNIIQLGITLCDENGNTPPGVCSWQFNFRFSLNDQMYAQDSIELLTKSGIDFSRLENQGIDVEEFGDWMMTSGMILNSNVKWISFHSGYDFGYFMKILTCDVLPNGENEFFERLNIFFPCIYDIKFLMKSCKSLKGGLQDVADDLQIERVGIQHQAGSDSLLTADVFFRMRQTYFDNAIDDSKFMGYLYGLGGNQMVSIQNSLSQLNVQDEL
ncbi:CCR4-NOT transcription complex subunit 7 [Rozella allomycis CSF55]|uniref:poly(A)-specific ribonuclease n=1 Tax=Rozella allomycis (strain CSF55) TaxID=988480 RepID=A0A075ASW2_ROZAC|nr:CCR4-NOT transcription complex subunit 7 [Rozella allomycis CSF55]|eukprot:EPZ33260.1 CCR4-NOT transcription complex subunit 7 [Rozella allomycis CSF55]